MDSVEYPMDAPAEAALTSPPAPQVELVITSAAPSVSAKVFQEFSDIAKLCHICMGHVAVEAGLPKKTEVVLADDLKAEVMKRMRTEPGVDKSFEPERPLGRVAGKNLAQDDKWDHVVIVFDAADWVRGDGAEASRKLLQTSLVAHEIAHPVLARIRVASGVADGVQYPSVTPGEIARSMTRVAMDEYFVDKIADILVGKIFSKGDGEAKQPAFVWDVSSADYKGRLRELLDKSYQELPGLVNACRVRTIPLEEMWRRVVSSLDHLLTIFIHARAHADASGDVPLLDSPEIKDLPFVRLYLADTIPALLSEFRDTPPILPPAEWRERELKVIKAGEAAIREIWRRLGLTFGEPENRGGYRIHVGSPLR